MATAEQTVRAVLDATNKRYLVEHQGAEDGSWWYDLYSDGYIVQGGTLPTKSTTYFENWSVPLAKSISKLISYGGTPFNTMLSGCVVLKSFTETTLNWAMSNAHESADSYNKQGIWWITGIV